MELVEHIDEFSQLGRLGLGAQFERLHGTPHYLAGGNPGVRALTSSEARSSGDIRTINRADAAISTLHICM